MSDFNQTSQNITPNKDEDWKDYVSNLPEIKNKFELISKIGEGAFAVVFIAKLKCEENIKEKFALKFTIPVLNANRIANEIRILKKLGGSKNVVKLYYSFRIKSKTFMLMEYIEHKRFHEYFLLIDEEEMKEYIKNLLIALEHIHKSQIIHRDIKPDNFLYDRKRKKFGLVDFGLSHSQKLGDLGDWFDGNNDNEELDDYGITELRMKRNLSNSGMTSLITKKSDNSKCICGDRAATCEICRSKPMPQGRRGGTMGYRAPEVVMGHDLQTTAIDVWAVGIILGSLLTGNYPFFRGETDLNIFYHMLHLLSLERMQSAAEAISRKIIVKSNIEPLGNSMNEVKYLRKRCQYLRINNEKLSKTSESNIENCKFPPTHKFNNQVYDLLSCLLEPSFNKRITCTNALHHPWFSS